MFMLLKVIIHFSCGKVGLMKQVSLSSAPHNLLIHVTKPDTGYTLRLKFHEPVKYISITGKYKYRLNFMWCKYSMGKTITTGFDSICWEWIVLQACW